MPRIKKLTDYSYSPTNPASEDAIRLQIDDAIQEVYDASAKNTDTVNLTGNQTVGGVKTLTDGIKVPVAAAIDNPIRKDTFETHKTSTDHDGRYYTETEADLILNDSISNHTLGLSAKHPANTIAFNPIPSITATETQTAISQVNERISNIITSSGTSSTEVVDSRLSSVFGAFNTLKERNDNTDTTINQTNKDIYKKGYIEFGEFELPSDFVNVPFNIYRDFDGLTKHNFDFTREGTEIYCDLTGSDATGDGSVGNPYKNLLKALQVANAGVDPSYLIKCKSERFSRFECPGDFTITGKKITIVPDNASNLLTMTNHTPSLSYVLDGPETWKATRSAVYEVFDLRIKDLYNNPIPLTYKTNLAECQATSNSWYTDGADIWIHTNDGLIPTDANFVVATQQNIFNITLLSNAELILENINFVIGGTTSIVSFKGDSSGATTQGKLVTKNCKSVGGCSRNVTSLLNSFETINLKNVYHFNTTAAYSARDGFNYHYYNVPTANRRSCLAFEYNCLSYKNGLNDANTNNNATTAHEGVSVLRIGGIGYETKGPILADVNGCYTICIDCNMRKSMLDELSELSASYYFDNVSFTTLGKAILINCSGKSPKYSIAGENDFVVMIQNFNGTEPKASLDVSEY